MSQFPLRYESTIGDLEHKLSDMIDAGSEFDIERNGDVLTIEFEDGERFVITPQTPFEQVWVSANYAGDRFNWSEEKNEWLNEKNNENLFFYIGHALSQKLGYPVNL